jgi:hypothetical protein
MVPDANGFPNEGIVAMISGAPDGLQGQRRVFAAAPRPDKRAGQRHSMSISPLLVRLSGNRSNDPRQGKDSE